MKGPVDTNEIFDALRRINKKYGIEIRLTVNIGQGPAAFAFNIFSPGWISGDYRDLAGVLGQLNKMVTKPPKGILDYLIKKNKGELKKCEMQIVSLTEGIQKIRRQINGVD